MKSEERTVKRGNGSRGDAAARRDDAGIAAGDQSEISRKGAKASEWRECKLGDLIKENNAELQTGPFGTMLNASEYTATGTPVIAVQDIGENRLHPGKLNYVPTTVADRLSRYKVNVNDIVFGRKGAVDRRAIISENENGWIQGSDCIRLRMNYTNDSKFISYQIGSPKIKDWLMQHAHGATMPSLNQEILSLLPLFLPPLPEQKAIAAVLSSLDDKIDLLHRQNKTLEAMAEALFRQWFVEEADEGHDVQITDLVELNPSRFIGKGNLAPYLEMANVSTSTFHPENWYDREFSSGMRFMNGDTLLARITPCLENGKSTYVTFLEENQVGWGSTEFIVMRSKGDLHPFFTYALVKNKDFHDYAEGCLVGSSGRQRVDIEHLTRYEIAFPADIKQFNIQMDSIVPKLNQNFIQIRTIEKLRDTLLPKLMSGEVRVEF